jgi:hypothetical protein
MVYVTFLSLFYTFVNLLILTRILVWIAHCSTDYPYCNMCVPWPSGLEWDPNVISDPILLPGLTPLVGVAPRM